MNWCAKVKLLFVCMVLGLCDGAKAVRADIVYNNLAPGGASEANDKTFANISRWGQQFTATSGGSFTNIKLNLYRRNVQSGTFTVQLWSTSGTGVGSLPSASLATLKTLDWADITLNPGSTNTASYVDINTFDANYDIVQDSVYWLVVSQAANGPQAKRWTTVGSGLGQTASYNGSIWTNAGSSPNLGAEITVATAVPEPGTFLIFALGLSFGAGFVWKKRSQGTPQMA